jgi:hypothetical protein
VVSFPIPPLQATLALQRAAHLADPVPTEAERRRDLKALCAFVNNHRDATCEAISLDFGYRNRVRVSRFGTFVVNRVLYSATSRLIGHPG